MTSIKYTPCIGGNFKLSLWNADWTAVLPTFLARSSSHSSQFFESLSFPVSSITLEWSNYGSFLNGNLQNYLSCERLAAFQDSVMVLRSFAQLAGGLVWATLILLRWIQKQFIHPLAEWWLESVLGTYEESLKSVIREAFSNLTRFVNGFFASVVALFVNKDYANTLQTNYSRTAAWQSWWGENKQSTFNAMIRRDQGRSSSDGRQSGSGKTSIT